MFTEHGLNVARQPDNAANPRPDNRSGWLAGETPDVVEELLGDPQHGLGSPAATSAGGDDGGEDGPADLNIRLWDPSTQLRYRAKRAVPPRPDGAPNREPDPVTAGWGD